jgi:hypothetical protein
MQKLIIEGELPDLNKIIDVSKKHWAKYHQFKKKYTELVAMVAKAQLTPVCEYPITISVDWYCPSRRKDPDNVAFAKKFILDGLVLAGILKSDSWKQISELHDRFFQDKENPCIEVTIQSHVTQHQH